MLTCTVLQCQLSVDTQWQVWEVQELLQKGMDALSQAEVASALQVYFNLGELTEVGPALSLNRSHQSFSS